MKRFQNRLMAYSQKEFQWMKKMQKIKGVIFYPLLYILTKLRVTANILSFISGMIAITFLVLAITQNRPELFILGIFIHFLLDGLDGSLARFQKKDSFYGAFIDMIYDYIGIISASIFILFFNYSNTILVLLYTLLYTLVLVNSLILGYIKRSYKYVLRPRIYIYIALAIDFYYTREITTEVLIITSGLMFLSSIGGIIKIGKYIKSSISN